MSPTTVVAARVPGSTTLPSWLRRLIAAGRRPPEMVEGSRWLFLLLAMVTLVIVSPGPVSTGNRPMLLVVLASSLVLFASWTWGFTHRRAPLLTDVIDAVAIAGFALSCVEPPAAWAMVFAALWFRSLYGSTGRAVVRCSLYALAMVAVLPLWPLVPGHTGPTAVEPILGNLPIMFLTVLVARHLLGILHARQQGAHRDAVHAAAGARLLSMTDATETRRVAWEASTEICAATPGLRVLKVVPEGDAARVDGAAGPYADVPVTLSAAVLADLEAARDVAAETQQTWAELDDAVGEHCTWTAVSLPDQTDQSAGAWLLLGAPEKVATEVVVSVTGFAMQVALALRNGEVHQRLTLQATIDGLTTLANRNSFNAALIAALADHRSDPTSVLFVDLDDFKHVNDAFGHAGGDELLREVASRIIRSTRPEDLCARLGGDEFAVLIRGATAQVVAEIAERIVEAVAVPIALGAGTAFVGASVGVATGTDETSPERLIHCADVAMYAAKAKGKNRIQLFVPGLLEEDSGQASFERELATAAHDGQLVVHYQPVLSLPDKTCTAVEALVRWQHPTRGLLYPDDFIAVAERTGAIRAIGDFVLHRACADVAAWESAHPSSLLSVHVNVSAIQLDGGSFGEKVAACLEESGIQPDRLVLEVTESVVISAPEAIDRLHNLAARGVTIAIDDFGTGYSALTTLRSLPVDIVKIDKSFVAGSTANREDRAVTEAVVQMATKLGLQTVAEGVERPEQQALLQAMGVDSVQGYLYLRPTDAAGFESWFVQHLAGRLPAQRRADVVVPLAPRSTA